MSINFIIGPAASGKTYFRKTFFADVPYIDLYEFQDDNCITVEAVTQSYDNAKSALIRKIQSNYPDIVFEHTLLRRMRREPYIQAIREITDMPIHCFVMMPDMDTYEEFCKQRNLNSWFEKEAFSILEIPTTKEGFDAVYIVKPMIGNGDKKEYAILDK